MSTIFCGALAGKISRLVKAEKEFRISQGQIASAVFSAVEVRDMRG